MPACRWMLSIESPASGTLSGTSLSSSSTKATALSGNFRCHLGKNRGPLKQGRAAHKLVRTASGPLRTMREVSFLRGWVLIALLRDADRYGIEQPMDDVLSLQSLTDVLADNKLIVSLLNLAGLAGLCYALVKTVKGVFGFFKEAWNSGVKRAWRNYKRGRSIITAMCCRDLHYFVARLSVSAIMLSLTIVGILISGLPMNSENRFIIEHKEVFFYFRKFSQIAFTLMYGWELFWLFAVATSVSQHRRRHYFSTRQATRARRLYRPSREILEFGPNLPE